MSDLKKTKQQENKKSKSLAATRIMERVQRKRARREASQTKMIPTIIRKSAAPRQETVTRPLPEPSAPVVPEQFYEVVLNDDMARLREAYCQKWVIIGDIIQIFLDKENLVAQQKNASLIKILHERHGLSREAYQSLQQISGGKQALPGKPLKLATLDLMLAQHLIQYRMAEHAEIQKMLRVQSNMHSLGIPCPLNTLLVSNKMLSLDMAKSLIAQFKKTALQQKQPTIEQDFSGKPPLSSKKMKKYPVISIALLFLVLSSSITGWFVHRKIGQIKRQRQITSQAKPEEKPAPPPPRQLDLKPIVPPPEPTMAQRQQQEKTGKKRIGLTKWGEYWITRTQKQQLAKKIPIGSQLTNFSFTLTEVKIAYTVRNRQPQMVIDGQFQTISLPAGLSLIVEVHAASCLGKPFGFGNETLAIDSDGKFRLVLAKLRQALPLGVYTLYFSVTPALQTEFIRYLCALKQCHEQVVHFRLGTPNQIKRYYEGHRELVRQTVHALDKLQKKLEGAARIEPKMTLKRWQKWAHIFQQKWRQTELEQKRLQQQGLAWTFPCIAGLLPQLTKAVDTMYAEVEKRYRNGGVSELTLLERQLQFQIIQAEIEKALEENHSQLVRLLQNSKLVSVEES